MKTKIAKIVFAAAIAGWLYMALLTVVVMTGHLATVIDLLS